MAGGDKAQWWSGIFVFVSDLIPTRSLPLLSCPVFSVVRKGTEDVERAAGHMLKAAT